MRAKIVLPSPQVKSQYLNFATLYEQQIGAKNQEITSLGNLRDTLLPKLISGELRLPDEQQPAKTVTA